MVANRVASTRSIGSGRVQETGARACRRDRILGPRQSHEGRPVRDSHRVTIHCTSVEQATSRLDCRYRCRNRQTASSDRSSIVGRAATEVSRDALTAMKPSPSVERILVDPSQRSLPFHSGSLRSVIAMEVPVVSDEAWFREECARVLEPGGAVLVSVHNALPYKALVSRLLPNLRAKKGTGVGGLVLSSRPWRALASLGYGRFPCAILDRLLLAPLSRASNSTWITAAVAIEQLLGLRLLIAWSPWVSAGA